MAPLILVLLLSCTANEPPMVDAPALVTASAAQPSPSGRWLATVTEQQDPTGAWLLVRVADARSGAEVARAEPRYAARHRTLVFWDAADRLWVSSADVGTSWLASDGASWTQTAWKGSGVEAPAWLRAQQPSVFSR